MGTTEENAAAPQGPLHPLHPLIHISQAYLSMLQQARHGLMQNGIEALKHALGLLKLSALLREVGVQCSLVTNLVTNLSPNLVTNLVFTKFCDNFVTE